MVLGFHSSATDNVDHDALWLAFVGRGSAARSTRAVAPGGSHSERRGWYRHLRFFGRNF